MSSDEDDKSEPEDNVFDKTDLERVGQFIDGPYDNEVIEFRPDIQSVMGRDPDVKDDPLRLDGPWIPTNGFKIVAAPNDWLTGGPSPFLYLWEDEPYDDPGAWRRAYKAEQKELDLDGPFISSFGSKCMNGLGTFYGTFWSFLPEPLEVFNPPYCSIEIDEEKDERLVGVANFLTKPGKKGGYGYSDICINPFPEWMEDPLYDLTEARREMREEFEAAMLGGIWIPTAHPGDYFDPNPFFDDRDPDGENETYDWDRLPQAAAWEELALAGPWIPNSFTKCINGNKDVIDPLEKFPPHDPVDEYEDPKADVFRPYDHDPELPVWKPQFGNRKRYQCSTVQYCINLWVNNMTFHRRFM